jgi:hypothetical protein
LIRNPKFANHDSLSRRGMAICTITLVPGSLV